MEGKKRVWLGLEIALLKGEEQMVMTVSRRSDLQLLTYALHDKYLSVVQIESQSGPAITVDIFERFGGNPFTISKRRLIGTLRIGFVSAIEIVDTEQIDFYDIKKVLYEDGILQFVMNIPLTLKFTVEELSLEYESDCIPPWPSEVLPPK